MKKHFFGYWVVFYCFILMFFVFTLIKSCHGLFVVPVTEGLHISRAQFSLVFTITGLSLAAALPVMSRLLNTQYMRMTIFISVLLAAVGFAAFSTAAKPWHFYFIAVIVGIGTAGCTNVAISLMIHSWFLDKRGLAMGIAFAGSGCGAAILSPLITEALANYGWQMSYLICGSALGVICLPLTFFCACRPQEKQQQPYQSKHAKETHTQHTQNTMERSPQELHHSPLYLLYLAALFTASIAVGGVHLQIPAYLTDLGHEAAFVTLIYSATSLCIIGGKLLLGMIFDRLGCKAGIIFWGITYILALGCLLLAKNPLAAFLFAFCYGCGAAYPSVGYAYMTGDFFGQKHYAVIVGEANMFYVIGAAIGPLFAGLIYDWTGGYQLAWILCSLLFAVAVLIFLQIKSHYKAPLSQKNTALSKA